MPWNFCTAILYTTLCIVHFIYGLQDSRLILPPPHCEAHALYNGLQIIETKVHFISVESVSFFVENMNIFHFPFQCLDVLYIEMKIKYLLNSYSIAMYELCTQMHSIKLDCCIALEHLILFHACVLYCTLPFIIFINKKWQYILIILYSNFRK